MLSKGVPYILLLVKEVSPALIVEQRAVPLEEEAKVALVIPTGALLLVEVEVLSNSHPVWMLS